MIDGQIFEQPFVEDKVPELNKKHTSCAGCCFAVWQLYDDGDGKNTQVDCELGRLKKYEHRGELIYAYDDTQNFCIVNRECMAKRNSFWRGKMTPSQAKEKVNREMSINSSYDVLVYIGPEHLKMDCKKAISDSLESILKQESLPKNLFIINHSGDDLMLPPIIVNMLRQKLIGSKINWKVCNIIEEGADRNRAIDITLVHMTNIYFVVINMGFKLPATLFDELNTAINDNLERFSILLPDDEGNCMISSQVLYKLIGGSTDKPFIQKVQEVSEIHNETYMVRKASDLCPSLR